MYTCVYVCVQEPLSLSWSPQRTASGKSFYVIFGLTSNPLILRVHICSLICPQGTLKDTGQALPLYRRETEGSQRSSVALAFVSDKLGRVLRKLPSRAPISGHIELSQQPRLECIWLVPLMACGLVLSSSLAGGSYWNVLNEFFFA